MLRGGLGKSTEHLGGGRLEGRGGVGGRGEGGRGSGGGNGDPSPPAAGGGGGGSIDGEPSLPSSVTAPKAEVTASVRPWVAANKAASLSCGGEMLSILLSSFNVLFSCSLKMAGQKVRIPCN